MSTNVYNLSALAEQDSFEFANGKATVEFYLDVETYNLLGSSRIAVVELSVREGDFILSSTMGCPLICPVREYSATWNRVQRFIEMNNLTNPKAVK